MTTLAREAESATLAAITDLTATLGHYPSPVDVAKYLGITRQLLQYRIVALESAGLIERINHGHALKIK